MPRPVFFSASHALLLNPINADPNYVTITVPSPIPGVGMGMIAFLCWRDSVDAPGAVVDPAGWTLRAGAQPTPSSYRILDRIAAAGEPANYIWSWAAGQEQVWAVILVYHSVNAAAFTAAAYNGAVAANGQGAPGATELRVAIGGDFDFLPANWVRAVGWTTIYSERRAATINGFALGLGVQDVLLAGDRTIASAGTAWYTGMDSTDTARELGALLNGGDSGTPPERGPLLIGGSMMGLLLNARIRRRRRLPGES